MAGSQAGGLSLFPTCRLGGRLERPDKNRKSDTSVPLAHSPSNVYCDGFAGKGGVICTQNHPACLSTGPVVTNNQRSPTETANCVNMKHFNESFAKINTFKQLFIFKLVTVITVLTENEVKCGGDMLQRQSEITPLHCISSGCYKLACQRQPPNIPQCQCRSAHWQIFATKTSYFTIANFRDKNVVFTHFCVDSPALALTALRQR